MAEIHAIQSGNWADASTWDLGRVPDVEDDVYIGDYTVNTLSITQITVKTIYFTGIGGITGNNVAKTLTCDIIADGANPQNSYCMYPSGNVKLTLIGNVTMNLVNDLQMLTYGGNIVGVGNFTSYCGSLLAGFSNPSCNWTGNMYLYNRGRATGSGYGNTAFQLNGLLYVAENSSAPYVMETQSYNLPRYIASIESYAAKPIFQSLTTTKEYPFRFGDIKLYNAPYLSEGSAVGSIVVEGELYIPNGTLNKDVYIVERTFRGKVTTRQYGAGFSDNTITDVNTEFINLNPNANTLLITKQQYGTMLPQESDVKDGVQYGAGVIKTGTYATDYPQESTVLKDVEYGDNQKGTLEVIAISGATATADNISVVNLTEQEVNRVKNCATVSTMQKCFEDFKEE